MERNSSVIQKNGQNISSEDSTLMDWNAEELTVWIENGLIPKELIDPLKQWDFIFFLMSNKVKLRDNYQSPSEEGRYQIIPHQGRDNEIFDFHVADKRSGGIVKVLEKNTHYELCEGVTLQVKEKELSDWEKETLEAKKLTKEEKKDLKSFIEKFAKEKQLTRKEIVTAIEEVRKPSKKKGKIRHGGHFTDCKLQYNYPDNSPSLFDLISPTTKEKIDRSNVEISKTTVGIKLTPSEDKLINAIYKLLHEKSENQNIQSELFYSGNDQAQLVPYGIEDQKEKSAFLRIKPTELYKEYIGESNYSGKEIENIKNILYGLNEKKFLIIYDRKRKIQKGNKTENRTDRIEEFQNLIKIVSYIEDMTDTELDRLNQGESSIIEQKGELVIALNPLLTDQINSKYIEYPTDINKRTVIASGGHLHITESINALRDYLLREITYKRYKCEINAERLPYLLKLDNYIKSHRKKLITDRINGAIKASRNLGIILNVEVIDGAQGQPKYVFYLNEAFE